MKRAGRLAAAALLSAAPALAQESFPGTEYISGKAGFARRMNGTLAVDETEILFADEHGNAAFAIPIATVTRASLLGVVKDLYLLEEIVGSRSEEFLVVETGPAGSGERVVFRCRKKQSPRMVTKINEVLAMRSGRETPIPVAPGTRVRIRAAGALGRSEVGTLIAVDETSLTMTVEGQREPLGVPVRDVTRLQVSRGRPSRIPGALAGAAIGALVGWLSFPDGFLGSSRGETALGVAGVGALFGSYVRPERWETIPFSSAQGSLAPPPRRVASFSVRLTF